MTDVIVGWSHEGAGPPTLFNVQRKEVGGDWSQIATVPWVDGTLNYTLQDTIPTSASYRVNAENAEGVTAWVESGIYGTIPGPILALLVKTPGV